MGKKVLNVIATGYRATLEEQDDTMVWLAHAMKDAGADLHVLLRGNAVCYAVRGQNATGLSFGEKKQTRPPELADDLAKLMRKGVTVYLVQDDMAERGIERTDLIEGLTLLPRSGIARLLAAYDLVWTW